MKNIFVCLLLVLGCLSIGNAAEGQIVYETASSSVSIKAVILSTSAAVLVSPTAAQSLRGDGKSVTWYSLTLYNVASSTAIYAFGASATVAPAEATCALGAPIGSGTEASPYWVTEQFQGMFMWAKAC